jgi:hypothetical protein
MARACMIHAQIFETAEALVNEGQSPTVVVSDRRWAAFQGMPARNWWRSKRCLTVRSQHTRSRGSDGERGLGAIEAGTTMRYWIHVWQSRYYRAHLEKDLFGEWTLVCVWGALATAHGGYSSIGVSLREVLSVHAPSIGPVTLRSSSRGQNR